LRRAFITIASSGPARRLRSASGEPSRVALTSSGVVVSVVPSARVTVSVRAIARLGRSGSCSQITLAIRSGGSVVNRNGLRPVSSS
jgi:hypothetical protein